MNLMKDEQGITAVEYGLMAALLGLGILAGASAVKNGTEHTYCFVGSKMPGSGEGPCQGPPPPPKDYTCHYRPVAGEPYLVLDTRFDNDSRCAPRYYP